MDRRIADLVRGERAVRVSAETSVREACQVMKMTGCTSLAVMEGERLLGVFSARNAALEVIAMGLDPDRTALAQLVAEAQPTVGPEATAGEALALLLDAKLQEIAVVEGTKLLGLLSLGKLVRACVRRCGASVDSTGAIRSERARPH